MRFQAAPWTYWTIGKDPEGFEVVTLTNGRFLWGGMGLLQFPNGNTLQIVSKIMVMVNFAWIWVLSADKNRSFVNVTTSKLSGSFPIVQYVGWLTELVLTRSRWADSTYDLGTYFRKNFCASRFPKFCYFGDYSTSLSGTFIFDQTKKYLFVREIWNFKVAKY